MLRPSGGGGFGCVCGLHGFGKAPLFVVQVGLKQQVPGAIGRELGFGVEMAGGLVQGDIVPACAGLTRLEGFGSTGLSGVEARLDRWRGEYSLAPNLIIPWVGAATSRYLKAKGEID